MKTQNLRDSELEIKLSDLVITKNSWVLHESQNLRDSELDSTPTEDEISKLTQEYLDSLKPVDFYPNFNWNVSLVNKDNQELLGSPFYSIFNPGIN